MRNARAGASSEPLACAVFPISVPLNARQWRTSARRQAQGAGGRLAVLKDIQPNSEGLREGQRTQHVRRAISWLLHGRRELGMTPWQPPGGFTEGSTGPEQMSWGIKGAPPGARGAGHGQSPVRQKRKANAPGHKGTRQHKPKPARKRSPARPVSQSPFEGGPSVLEVPKPLIWFMWA
jgi:hypothetical protein